MSWYTRRIAPPHDRRIRNRLLIALPDADYRRLLPDMKIVPLTVKQVLHGVCSFTTVMLQRGQLSCLKPSSRKRDEVEPVDAGDSVLVQARARAVEQTSPDGTLVARAIAGEREAFGAIYQRYHAGIYQFARAMTGSPALAEDVTQDVFLELIRTLDRCATCRG